MKLHLFLSQTPTPSISHNPCSTFPSCFINYQSLLSHWNDFMHLHSPSLTNRAPYVSSLIPSGLFSIYILPITNRSCLLPFFETLIYLCFPDSLPDSSLHLPEGAYATFFASSCLTAVVPKGPDTGPVCCCEWSLPVPLHQWPHHRNISPNFIFTSTLPLSLKVLLPGSNWPIEKDF